MTEFVNTCAKQMVVDKDNIIFNLIRHIIGHDFEIEEIKNRLSIVLFSDIEIYYFDNKPIIKFYPVSFLYDDNILTYTQQYEVLI